MSLFDYPSRLFRGRLDRKNYLIGMMFTIVLQVILALWYREVGIPGNRYIGFYILLYVLLYVFTFSLQVRRFHDFGIPGGIQSFFASIPLLGWLLILYLAWKKGDNTSNNYGEKPNETNVLKAMVNF